MILPVEVNVFGLMDENTYFFIDDATRHGFLIDPGWQADELLEVIERKRFTIEKILLTHGHFDHIGAAGDIQSELNIPVCMRKGGEYYVANPEMNRSGIYGKEIVLGDVTYLDDGTEIFLSANANFGIKLLAAPGHTTDSAIYYSEKFSAAFVGDTIFFGGYGRTDLPGGDERELLRTIREKIFTLPDDTILFTGHGLSTTIAIEKSLWRWE